MTYRIKISREWSCFPRGGPEAKFAAGCYTVPDQISDYLAQRCLHSGIGKLLEHEEHVKRPAPQNKMRGRAPENKAAS